MILRCPACAKGKAINPCNTPDHNLYVSAWTTVRMWDHWKHLLTPDQRDIVQAYMDSLKRALDDKARSTP